MTGWKSLFTCLLLPHSITSPKTRDKPLIKYYRTLLFSWLMWCSSCYSVVGVDGSGIDGNIAGSLLWKGRVYSLLLGIRRGSSVLMLKPDVVIEGTICLEVQKRDGNKNIFYS